MRPSRAYWGIDDYSITVRSPGHREQLPASRDALQLVLAPLGELDPRADNEVLHRPGDQYFPGRRHRTDPRGDMDGQSTEIVAPDLALAGVQSSSDFDAEAVSCLDDFGCASNAASRSVEAGQETVSGGLDLLSTESHELITHKPVMRIEQRSPASITELSCFACRVHDVSEEGGGEDALNLDPRAFPRDELGNGLKVLDGWSREPTNIGALNLEKRRPLDVVGQVSAELDSHYEIAAGVRNERWHLDEWKRLAHIEVSQDVVVLSGSRTGGGRRSCDPGRPLSDWVVNGQTGVAEHGELSGAPRRSHKFDERVDGVGSTPIG